jgi:5-methyltetrahydrofolate--homocysteine methyltransferase
VKADAIGMSGLLVKSTLIMRDNLEELNGRNLSDIPVLLGGAALTRSYVERDLRDIYDGRLFYGKDAFEGLHTMDQLMEGKKSGSLDPDFGRALGGRILPPRRSEMEAERVVTAAAVRSDVAADVEIFTPPFLGPRVGKGTPLDEIAAYINETALFRNQWQFRPDKSLAENDTDFKERIRPILRAQLDESKAEGWLVPAVIWGYFPVNADGNDLIVWTDNDRRNERLRFSLSPPTGRPSSLHRRLLPQRRVGRRRLRGVPRRHRGRTRLRTRA